MDRISKIPQPRLFADQSAFNYTESQAATTNYADSMAEQSYEDDGRTNVSTYSYRSAADAARFLKQAHGRTVNATNDTYFLPTDDDEWNRTVSGPFLHQYRSHFDSRSDKQHTAFTLGIGGLYPADANVPAILRPKPGETKKILDLGCGTGVWTVAMAREFPTAQVLGVDLAPVPTEPEDLPPNCRFEVDDINLGLGHFDGQFDLIHSRLIGSGLKDFRKSMLDVEKCLKPGGLALWLDVDYDFYCTTNFIYKPPASDENPTGSWLQKVLYEMRRAAVLGGADIPNMEHALDSGLWHHPMMDPETCRTASLYIPIGPWAAGGDPQKDQYFNYMGSVMRQDSKSAHRAVHPLLMRSGWSRETVNEWSEKADEEMESMIHQSSWRIRVAWGRRRAANNGPAPPLPTIPEDPDARRTQYPHFYVYGSQEESLAQAELRSRDMLKVPPPHPSDKNKAAET